MRHVAIFGVLGYLAATRLAVAADEPGPLTRSLFPVGGEICLSQDFAESRDGQVTKLMLYRLMRPNPTYEYTDSSEAAQRKMDEELTFSVPASVIARFKGSKGDYVQSVSCWDNEGKVRCGVDCDGGGFTAASTGNGLALSFGEGGMLVRGGCGDEGETYRTLEEKSFPTPALLRPQAVSACVEADTAAALSFSRELVSLRERMEKNGWNCLRRSYDAAHLKRNPKQKVKGIAVRIRLAKQQQDDGTLSTEIAAKASILLRDGRRASRELTCYASQYEFTCGSDFRLKRRSDKDALLIAGEYPGAPHDMLGLTLGEGDDVFRLDASMRAVCELE